MSAEQVEEGAEKDRGQRVPSGLPTIYADQVVDVLYGAYTSKVVLGFEDGTSSPRPTATLVLPTGPLLTAALEIVRNLSEPAVLQYTSQRYSDTLHVMGEAASKPAREVRKLSREVPGTTEQDQQ